MPLFSTSSRLFLFVACRIVTSAPFVIISPSLGLERSLYAQCLLINGEGGPWDSLSFFSFSPVAVRVSLPHLKWYRRLAFISLSRFLFLQDSPLWDSVHIGGRTSLSHLLVVSVWKSGIISMLLDKLCISFLNRKDRWKTTMPRVHHSYVFFLLVAPFSFSLRCGALLSVHLGHVPSLDVTDAKWVAVGVANSPGLHRRWHMLQGLGLPLPDPALSVTQRGGSPSVLLATKMETPGSVRDHCR